MIAGEARSTKQRVGVEAGCPAGIGVGVWCSSAPWPAPLITSRLMHAPPAGAHSNSYSDCYSSLPGSAPRPRRRPRHIPVPPGFEKPQAPPVSEHRARDSRSSSWHLMVERGSGRRRPWWNAAWVLNARRHSANAPVAWLPRSRATDRLGSQNAATQRSRPSPATSLCLVYQAKCAKALLASACLWAFSRLRYAPPSLL